ncbi:MAG: cytochrome c biogenesis protein CcdA [Variovorax sp.]
MIDLALAFLAGLATVAAPCVLPMLPIVLGGSLGPSQRSRPLFITAGFVAAFAIVTVVFSLFSQLAGLSAQGLRNAAVAALVLFGLSMLWRRPFDALAVRASGAFGSIAGSGSVPRPGRLGGFMLGLSLGAVWTPCAGPVLGAALTLLATAPEPRRAALLLLCYALGAGLPMLAVAYGGRWASVRLQFVARHLVAVQRLFGLLVIAVALAMFFQYDVLFTAWLTRFLPSISQGL